MSEISGLFLRADECDSLSLASGEFLTWKATAEVMGGKYDQLEFTTLPNSGPRSIPIHKMRFSTSWREHTV